MTRKDTPHLQGGGSSGIAMTEVIVVVVVVLLLVLGSLLLFNPGEPGDGAYVPPWRQTNGVYAYQALEEFRGNMQAYYDQFGALAGDRSDESYTNSTNATIGNSNGRIQKNNEENLKVFRDLYTAGITPHRQVRIRGRVLDIYWMHVQWDDGSSNDGHYTRLDGFNTLEAQAMDSRYDDGEKSSGDILFFPYEQDDEFSTLLVKFSLFR